MVAVLVAMISIKIYGFLLKKKITEIAEKLGSIRNWSLVLNRMFKKTKIINAISQNSSALIHKYTYIPLSLFIIRPGLFQKTLS